MLSALMLGTKQRHNAGKALVSPGVDPILLEKVLADDRSSWLDNSSQERHRIDSAVELLASARG